MSTARRNLRRTPSEAHVEVIDVSPSKASFVEAFASEQLAEEGRNKEALSNGAPPKPPEPRNNLDFRDFSMGSKPIDNPVVERLRQDTHALVGAGLVDESDLQGVAVRVLDFTDTKSAPYQPDEIGRALEPLVHEKETAHGVVTQSHFIAGDFTAITVNGKQADGFASPGGTSQDALRSVYLHELGHAAVRIGEVKERLQLQAASDKDSGLPEDVRKSAVGLVDNPNANAYFNAHNGSNYSVVVGEMYADVYMLAARQQLDGEAVARTHLAGLQVAREAGHIQDLREMGPEGTLVASHNTTHALKAYEGVLKSGEAAAALREGRGLDVVDKVTYQAFMAELVEKTAANLNVHHLDKDGMPAPGLPAGVTREQLVTAHVRGELQDPGSGFTLLMAKGLTAELKEEGITMIPGGTRANLDTPGKVDFRADIPSLPGFEALSTSSFSLTVRDSHSAGETTYRFGSPVETYLEEKGVAAIGSLAVESLEALREVHYKQLANKMAELGPAAVEYHNKTMGAPPMTKGQLESERGTPAPTPAPVKEVELELGD